MTGPGGNVGYMLQQDCLYEWRTILGNALLGLEVKRALTPENVAAVKEMLRKYGLGGFERHYPRHLSGGMRQRAALIRTLAIRPDVLLLDEPLSALDYQTRLAVSVDLFNIMRSEGVSALMVTHDISEAIAMSDRVLVMTKRWQDQVGHVINSPATVRPRWGAARPRVQDLLQRHLEGADGG